MSLLSVADNINFTTFEDITAFKCTCQLNVYIRLAGTFALASAGVYTHIQASVPNVFLVI